MANIHFHRYVNYQRISHLIQQAAIPESARIVEFGGSNGVIFQMMSPQAVEVAPNYPEVNIQSLSSYEDASCDVAIIDQILEHVPDPAAAVGELYRILRPNGTCICVTPFLICIHGYPDDYGRFTGSGLNRLFSMFSKVEVKGWGNRFTLETFNKYGWLSAKNSRWLLRSAL